MKYTFPLLIIEGTHFQTYYCIVEAKNPIFKISYNAQKNIKMKIQIRQYQNWIIKDCQRPKVTHMLPWSMWGRINVLWLDNVTPKGFYPSWLDCMWKMVTFFSSWISLFKVKITSTPLRGMEEKTKRRYAKCPDLGKKSL